MKTHPITVLGALAALVCLTSTLMAQETPAAEVDQAAELAKKLANPVASLVSVPFQGNWDFGIGENDAQRFTLNFQPVTPFSISDDWNLIVRTILPIIDAESPAPGIGSASGLGDVVQSFFFSPKEPVGGWILAAGPVFLWPTATDSILGSEQWGAGPTALALRQTGPWTYGALVNQIWSYAGDSGRSEVNATFLQPFLAYITPTKTTISVNAESTYNWTDAQWTVPVNLMVSQMIKLGNMPAQVFVGGRYYAESPAGGPEWGIRAGLTLLFPAK
jgi:hypothetical protein